jgi:hypothetical protein
MRSARAATAEDELRAFLGGASGDRHISAAEMRAFLVAVGAWGTEPAFRDFGWPASWAAACEKLGADPAAGLPVDCLRRYHERYRWGRLETDLALLRRHDGSAVPTRSHWDHVRHALARPHSAAPPRLPRVAVFDVPDVKAAKLRGELLAYPLDPADAATAAALAAAGQGSLSLGLRPLQAAPSGAGRQRVVVSQ